MTVYLFVGTLPYSQYSYVEPTSDMKMDTFIRCHIRMYEYFEGVTTRLICDNLKTGVVSHPKVYIPIALHHVHGVLKPLSRKMRTTFTETVPLHDYC